MLRYAINYLICKVLSSVRPVIFAPIRIFSLLSGRPKPEARSDRIEFAILARDQIVGEGKARHCFEASGPCFETGPMGDVEPALGHEHHAAPAADIRDRALLAYEKGTVLNRVINKGQGRLGTRAELGDDLVVHPGGTAPSGAPVRLR